MNCKISNESEEKISNNENYKANNKKWHRCLLALLIWIRKPTVTDWLIAAFTCAIVVIGFFQWQALKRTDQTSRLRDRAFVYFLDPTFIPYPYPPNKPTSLAIAINVENAGNMPARRISIRYACVENKQNIPDPFPLAKWTSAQAPNVIGPKQRLSLQGGEIPIDTIEKVRKSNTYIFILTEVKYIDGFDLDKFRITQMSRSLHLDEHGGQRLGFAGPHNCTDDDCSDQRIEELLAFAKPK